MLIFLLTILFVLLHIGIACKISSYSKAPPPRIAATSYKKMCLLIPCYNEAIILKSAIFSLTQQDYPDLEVVFINDGSEDGSIDLLKKELGLTKIATQIGPLKCNEILATYASSKHKNMFVIDKKNGGKADSLNAGINFTDKEYIVTLDADSILKENALYEINNSLQEDAVIAVGGNVMVAQGVSNYSGDVIHSTAKATFLELAQFIEYLRSFFVLKNSYASLNALTVISGAFGVFNRAIMLKLNGFEDTIGEDIDITIKFNKYALANNKKLVYNDKALCFTEVPNNWSDVKKQRVRWQKAFLDALKNHRSFLFKNLFRNKLAFFMIIESTLLMYVSTIITIVGLIHITVSVIQGGSISPSVYIMFIIGSLIFLLYNITTFFMARKANINLKNIKIPHMILILLYEFLLYRPIMIAIILYGSIAYLFNPKGWNKVQRLGVSDCILLNDDSEEVA